MSVIKTENLTKYYGKSRGIVNLDLNVDEGDFFGFIGPNGAGKSTTILTLLGLIFPTSGSAFVLGNSISKPVSYLDKVGYMPSEAMFYSGMKVNEIISYSAKLRRKNCDEEAKYLCERLNLDTSKRVDELSLGNRKKVAIVCAMQHKPELYIFDEPTSGLDPLIQKEFFDILKDRNNDGASIFFSSHVLSEIQHNCSKAAIIRSGKLIALDSIENLAKTNAKRVTLHGVNKIPECIKAKSVTVLDNSINFLYNGDIKLLISEVNKLPLTDMTITEPELEEVFMHYYEGDNK